MKQTLFSKSFRILILLLMLLAILFNRKLSQQLMLAAILIWSVLMVCYLFGPKIMALLSLIRTKYAQGKEQMTQVAGKQELAVVNEEPVQIITAPANEIPTAVITPAPDPAGTDQQELKRMLQHVSLRITEKIKSAYPDATWQWETEPGLSAILEGKTFRIAVQDMDSYTHADVRFDQFARIHITPLIIGEFAAAGNSGTDSSEVTKEPPVVDVLAWYELIGKQALEEIVTELNAKGHSRLTIKENGDITIHNNKKEIFKGTLKQFPPKNYWNELLKLLGEYELQGRAEKDHIVVSWI